MKSAAFLQKTDMRFDEFGGSDVATAEQWRERTLGPTLEAPGGGPRSSCGPGDILLSSRF